MSGEAWISLAGAIVAVIAIIVPVAMRWADKYQKRIELLQAENRALVATNTELKIQVGNLQTTTILVDRLFEQIPYPRSTQNKGVSQ